MAAIAPARSFVVARDLTGPHAALTGGVFALGNFDGVHRGHRAVVATAMERARSVGTSAAVLTFEPHPRAFFRPQEPLFRLTDERNKLRLLRQTGLDGVVVMTFDRALAGLSAEDFVAQVLVGGLNARAVVIGFNFHFGRNRAGSPDFLMAAGSRYGFAVDIVPAFADGERTVSSGPIREALVRGEVDDAADLLGHPWFVTGTVVHGDKRGRELGFPTANLRLDPSCALRHGIYAVRLGADGRQYDGVASFGRRPMFDTGTILLEVFVFDFSGDLYGKAVDIAFIEWIRPEMAFDSIEALVRRMDEDSRIARSHLARRPPTAFPPPLDASGFHGSAKPVESAP